MKGWRGVALVGPEPDQRVLAVVANLKKGGVGVRL